MRENPCHGRQKKPENDNLHRQHSQILENSAGKVGPEGIAVKNGDPQAVQQQMDQYVDQSLGNDNPGQRMMVFI